MLINLASILSFLLLFYLILAFLYSAFLVLVYFLLKDTTPYVNTIAKKIAIIVPAHNEELIIASLCENLNEINYNRELYDVFFVADNCNDKTATICGEYNFKVFERNDDTQKGKGYAIKFAFENVPLDEFDACLMIDADTHVNANILYELSKLLNNNRLALQCYINIPNANESWFTQLLSVARVMNGLFYHYPKHMLGLSSYLMGTGICFSTNLIKAKGWTAFSIAEDWEYYAQLILDGYKVHFAKDALVYQYESKTLRQATSQRLRWSSGRWKVTKSLGVKLMVGGLKKRDLMIFDSSLPLIFPNYSLQINLAFAVLILSVLLPASNVNIFIITFSLGVLIGQGLIFIAGAFVAGSPWKTICAAFYVPLFLIWKSVIDILCFSGIYQGKEWVRTRRHHSYKSTSE